MNFENIAPILFASNTYNRNIIRMDIDEACYLYQLLKVLNNPKIIEIGTYKGGSTLLMACTGAKILTIDNYSSKTFNEYLTHKPQDDVLALLKDYHLDNNVKIIIGDSTTYPNSNIKCDVLFIDGDHSYEGVKKDYIHWIHCLKVKGHLIFHDSCWARENATGRKEVAKFLTEIPYKRHFQVGSLTHFIKENNDGFNV